MLTEQELAGWRSHGVGDGDFAIALSLGHPGPINRRVDEGAPTKWSKT